MAARQPHVGDGQIPGIALALVAVTALYRFGGQVMRTALAVQLKPVAALLPRTAAERWVFALLALTAGICEEVLYRGASGWPPSAGRRRPSAIRR